MLLSRLVHDRHGRGAPLVLLHGIGHRRQAWDPIVERLAKSYEVFTVDLAGFGESPAYPRGVPHDMDTTCRNLALNFAEWGIERPHVVGNSLGGAISLELAARGLVSSVTALSPAGFFGRVNRLQAFFLLIALRILSKSPMRLLRAASRSPIGRRLIGSMLYAHPGRVDQDQSYGDALALRNATAFGRTIKAGVNYKFDSPVAVPATVAWGTRDRILPYSQSARAQERLTGARHVALPYCGHVPMIDDPDLVTRIIEQTITEGRQDLETATG